MLLPRYANNGSDAVPDNVVALLFFPVYSAFMILLPVAAAWLSSRKLVIDSRGEVATAAACYL